MSNEAQDVTPVRRVVTGHDANGVAKVVTDGIMQNVRSPHPGTITRTVWCTDAMPADISIGEQIEDYGLRPLTIPPPVNGTRFSVLELFPGNAVFLHRTETLDYVSVLAGEVDMDLDDSTVKLKAGDVVIQRGTDHAWVNRGTVPARISVVLVDAKPLGIGKPVPRAGG